MYTRRFATPGTRCHATWRVGGRPRGPPWSLACACNCSPVATSGMLFISSRAPEARDRQLALTAAAASQSLLPGRPSQRLTSPGVSMLGAIRWESATERVTTSTPSAGWLPYSALHLRACRRFQRQRHFPCIDMFGCRDRERRPTQAPWLRAPLWGNPFWALAPASKVFRLVNELMGRMPRLRRYGGPGDFGIAGRCRAYGRELTPCPPVIALADRAALPRQRFAAC